MMSDDDLRFVHVAGLIFGQPLLATVEAAETIGAYVRGRMEGIEVRASRFVGEQQIDQQTGRWKGYRAVGPVAAISIMGELVNRGAWMGASSGLSSYEGVIEQVRQAAADPTIKAIVLDINSPGGEAWGMVDAARQIRAAAGDLRLVAVANSIAASAAYGLACVADEVVVNEAGLVGSIGVVTVHYDQTERLKNNGVKATIVATGSKKMVGHSAIPLDADGLALLQARAGRIMQGYVDLLVEYRPQLTAEEVYKLEGDILIGSDAVKAGLADRVGTFESVLADLTRAAGRSTSSTKGKPMNEPNSAPAADAPAGITKTQLDEAVAKATADTQAGFEAKLKADRERMAALDKLGAECAGCEDGAKIIADAKSSGASAADTALQLVQAGVFKKAAVLGAMQQDDASAAGASAANAGDGSAAVPQTAEGWTAEWNASKDLQAEFASVASYVAFKKAEAGGRFKVYEPGARKSA